MGKESQGIVISYLLIVNCCKNGMSMGDEGKCYLLLVISRGLWEKKARK